MKKEKIKFKSNGLNIIGVLNIPEETPAPGIVLCHGGTNNKENCPTFPHLWQKLVNEGYIVMRFDFFGSGESDGDFRDKTNKIMYQNVKDALDFFNKDSRVDKSRIGIWGRSQSGTQLSCLVDDRIQCRVLQSPVLDGIGAFERYYKKDWERYKKNPEKYLMIKETDSRDVKGPYGYSKEFINEWYTMDKTIAKALPKISHVLLTQGDADKETTVEEAKELYKMAKSPKELYIFHGVGHKYEGAEESSVALVVHWFNRWLKNNN